ncbi:hypothetical protein D3C86_2034290 [compost metagenome]
MYFYLIADLLSICHDLMGGNWFESASMFIERLEAEKYYTKRVWGYQFCSRLVSSVDIEVVAIILK